MSVSGYETRLLEIHGNGMWSLFHVERAMQFAARHAMTGIIFHCNELIDRVVFPDAYFTKDELLSYNPVRNSVVKNNRYYLQSVLDRCADAGLEFYAEVKEIFFHHDLLTKYPDLRGKNGALCPTNPFWRDFVEAKVAEFLSRFPAVAGISVSPGTRESLVSFAAGRCDCDRCRGSNADEWYRNLLTAMQKPVEKAGKRLIVRDFSYTKAHQHAMVDAARAVSDKITMALKKVPHDYYPVFPDNPAVGNCGGLDQWIEYDAWGQFFGLGFFPCSVVEDMRGRMRRYREKGATGVTMRTDWENFSGSSVFSSFNTLNLVAGAMLGRDINTPLEDIYRRWLEDGLVSPLISDTEAQSPCVPSSPEAAAALGELARSGWRILEKTLHVRGHVFNRNSQFFDRYDLAYNIMTVFHSRDQWEPGASKRVEPTDENIALMLAEKDEALTLARSLRERIKPELLGVNGNIREYLEFLLDVFPAFVEGFRLECATAAYTRRAELDPGAENIAKARGTFAGYQKLAGRIDSLVKSKRYCHLVSYMLDASRLLRFRDTAAGVLDRLEV